MNHDMVFWSVIISVAGSALTAVWLIFMAFRRAYKDQDKK
jgi:hypothetical protein